MTTLGSLEDLSAIRKRTAALVPGNVARWGSMSVDQMRSSCDLHPTAQENSPMPQSNDARIAELSHIPEHTAEAATHERDSVHPGGGEKNWESAPTQPAPAVSSLVHGKAAALAAKKLKLEAAGELAPTPVTAGKSLQSGRITPAVGFALGALGVGIAVLARAKRRS